MIGHFYVDTLKMIEIKIERQDIFYHQKIQLHHTVSQLS